MSNHKKIKEQITKAVLKQVPDDANPYLNTPFENTYINIWQTGRQDGFRLTHGGVKLFELANIEYYDYHFKVSPDNFNKLILELNKKIKCPYFIGLKDDKKLGPYIRLYDDKIAMVFALYGSLEDYLNSIKVRI